MITLPTEIAYVVYAVFAVCFSVALLALLLHMLGFVRNYEVYTTKFVALTFNLLCCICMYSCTLHTYEHNTTRYITQYIPTRMTYICNTRMKHVHVLIAHLSSNTQICPALHIQTLCTKLHTTAHYTSP